MPEPIPYGVYISGPMQGVPEFNYPLFNHVAYRIVMDQQPTPGKPARGTEWIVHPINPAANFEGQTDLSREVYLELALRQVDEAKAIVMLPGWQESPGARLELVRAMHNGADVWLWTEGTHMGPGVYFQFIIHPEAREMLDKTKQPVSDAPYVADSENIEHEAARLVRQGKRQQDYGHPRGDFDTIAALWNAILQGRPVTAEYVALMMAALKLARLSSNPKHHDSKVDVIGYMICLDRLDEPLPGTIEILPYGEAA